MVNPEQRITIVKDPLEAALRKLLKGLISQSRKSRANIADEMSLRVERKISKRMVDDWISPKQRARFPAAFIEVFCEVIGDDTLQRHVMGARLRGIVELREQQLTWVADSLRAELLKPKPQRKPKGKRPRKS
jgi:hypothetical protein